MICHFILYVSDQERSTRFFQKVFDREPDLNVPGMTEFRIRENCIIGLMPSKGIKRLLGDSIQDPEIARGIPRAEIYLRVSNPTEMLTRALQAGGTELSKFQERNWGESAGYVADPDGHVIAFST
jgi:uncharacterized glyoxalase superfamily protein PhnB